MTRAGRLLLIGTVLAGLGAGLWAWREHRVQERRQRAALWTQYLRGPLSQLLEGSYDGRTLLAQTRPLAPAQRKALVAAAALVQAADAAMQALAAQAAADPFFAPLRDAARWHAELAETSKDWPRVAGHPELVVPALEAERGLRLRLAGVLDRQREDVFLRLKLSQESWLEMNALLYTLKE